MLNTGGFTAIPVLSLAPALTDPPPVTVTYFVSGAAASAATTLSLHDALPISPPLSASLRVQVFPPAGHVHPVPAIDASVIPVGTVSVTVTVPLLGVAPAALDTVTMYVAPFCPCEKFPK